MLRVTLSVDDDFLAALAYVYDHETRDLGRRLD